MATSEAVLVIGHHNPDTDAICSALAYADLYSKRTGTPAEACYLDEIGPETAWLLNHLQLAPPRHIEDVFWRVSDVMIHERPAVSLQATIREAGILMRDQEIGAVPVVDEAGQIVGLLARDLLADRYLQLLQLSPIINRPATNILAVLEATVLAGDPTQHLSGQVWVGTFSPRAAREQLQANDIVIVEDDSELQQTVVDLGVALLIVARSAPVPQEVLALAQARHTLIARTSFSSLAAIALIEQSVVVSSVMEPGPAVVRPGDLLSDAQQHLRTSRRASLPVVDEMGTYQGLLLRRALVPQDRRRVILTDHNHASQAAAGVTESELVAVIDHHNLGGLRTLQPLTMHIDPVGCCSTLIAEEYRSAELMPERALAGAMLGAILSDTVQFRSPTTTPRDRAIAEWLAEISGESIDELARAMFRARLPNPVPPADWWVSRDWKTYSFGDQSIGIAQMELVDIIEVMPPFEQLRNALAEQIRRENLTSAFLMLTDIIGQRSILIAGNTKGEQIAERAFNQPLINHLLELAGVMSRKKQVIPQLASALNQK